MLKIIWSEKYINYDFGPDHPFWAQRGNVFLDLIKKSNLKYEVIKPPKAVDENILLVHTQKYLDEVKQTAKKNGNLSADTPLSPSILESAYYLVGGSILASQLALNNKKVINLLGGFHHAETNRGGGFSIFADQAIAIRKLQEEKQIEKAMIFDIDAHAGNGTQKIFYNDQTVFNISLHQDPHTLYPGTGFTYQKGEDKGKGFNLNIPLPPKTSGRVFLNELKNTLTLHKNYHPNLSLLILGTDTYKDDPLTQMGLVENDFFEIGKLFKDIEKLGILCAGGYSKKTPQLWLEFIKGLTN